MRPPVQIKVTVNIKDMVMDNGMVRVKDKTEKQGKGTFTGRAEAWTLGRGTDMA